MDVLMDGWMADQLNATTIIGQPSFTVQLTKD